MVTAEIHEADLEAFLADPALEGLLAAHYDELGQLKHLQKLQPMFDAWREAHAAGRLVLLGVYAPHLIGYSVGFLSPLMHHAGTPVMQSDLLYLDWRYRERSIGRDLLKATREVAKARGAGVVLWSAQPGTALHRIAMHRRWKQITSVFAEEV